MKVLSVKYILQKMLSKRGNFHSLVHFLFVFVVDNYMPVAIENMVQNIFTCCFAIIFICYIVPWFCLPLIILAAIFFYISKIFR